MKRLLGIFLIFTVLAGCASTQTIKSDKLSSIKRIGAVSLLGDELRVTYTGVVSIANEWKTYDVTDWRVDEYVRGVIGKSVSSAKKYEFVDIGGDSDAMKKIYGSKKPDCCYARRYDLDLIKDEIRNIRANHDVDTLVLVLEGDSFETEPKVSDAKEEDPEDQVRSTTLTDYGLYRDGYLGADETFTHTYFRVIVIDTRSLEELTFKEVTSLVRIDNKYWEDGFEDLSPDRKQFVKRSIEGQLLENIVSTLREMGLVRKVKWTL